MAYKNKVEEQKAIHALIEAGEVFVKRGNKITLDFKLAKRIWREVASVIGKQSALSVPKKKRILNAKKGGLISRKKK